MDEHSPYFTPKEPISWRGFFAGVGRALLLVIAVAMVVSLLPGCEDIDRQVRVAEFKDRFVRGCLPRKGDRITAEWIKGNLVCTRIEISAGRYARSFPHVEIRAEEIEL